MTDAYTMPLAELSALLAARVAAELAGAPPPRPKPARPPGAAKMGPPLMTESVIDGVRQVDPVKLALVAQVHAASARGLSPQRIADALNAAGVPSANGKRWHVRTVRVALGFDPLTGQLLPPFVPSTPETSPAPMPQEGA